MTIDEKLNLILMEMQGMKSEMQGMKSEMQGMKSEMQGMKSEMQGMKSDVQSLDRRMTNVEVTLENEIVCNIKLLAENHGNLIDKLNQAIKVSDKTAIYEIQVNILTGKVERLEKEVSEIKNHIA